MFCESVIKKNLDSFSIKISLSNNSDCSSSGKTKTCDVTDNGTCSVYATATDFTEEVTENIPVSSPGFTTVNVPILIQRSLACTVSCPSSIEVISGQTKDYDVTVSTTPAGCGSLDSCTISSNSFGLESERLDANTCYVTSTGTGRSGSAKSTATAGTGSCDTNVFIKGPGWVETNPQ